MMICSLHGRSFPRKPACRLSSEALDAYRARVKQGPKKGQRATGYLMTVVTASQPEHGAVASTVGDEEHEAGMLRCLRSSIRSAKIKLTKRKKAGEVR